MRIWTIGGLMVLALAGTMPASAQSDFEREVLRRLERLERRVDELERGESRTGGDRPRRNGDGERNEVVAAVSLLCGGSCEMTARSYCQRIDFRNGVAVAIEKRGPFDHVTRVRCFN